MQVRPILSTYLAFLFLIMFNVFIPDINIIIIAIDIIYFII